MVFQPGGSQDGNPVDYSHHFPPLSQVRALSVYDQPDNMPNRDVSHRPNSEGINDDDWDSSSPSDPDNDRYCEQIRRLLRRQPGETRSQHYERIDQQHLSQRRNLYLDDRPSPGLNSDDFDKSDPVNDDYLAELLRLYSEDFYDSDPDYHSDTDYDSDSDYEYFMAHYSDMDHHWWSTQGCPRRV